MHATISRWGNSLALRLPRTVMQEINLAEGASVNIVVEDGSLRVTPSRKRFKLADLLVDEKRATETDWGKPSGDEVW